jgi:DNA invertase Pin-like site-specific DNA recombinase
MARLTMNMLMSFAEFEREMISERTRGKIAGARRKGKWTGGPVPFGYSAKDKKLLVNDAEALVVREAFALFLAHRQMAIVARELNRRGLLPRASKHGRKGGPIYRAFVRPAQGAPLELHCDVAGDAAVETGEAV